jgi:hypothetical protein
VVVLLLIVAFAPVTLATRWLVLARCSTLHVDDPPVIPVTRPPPKLTMP